MANRLTRIYTRSGDGGQTGLADGERVSKRDPRINACGDVDETNCAIGIVLSEPGLPPPVRESLSRIQNELFDLGAELARSAHTAIGDEHVLRLESELDELNSTLTPLKDFILPGGGRAAATCHLARAICRRAERSAWRVSAHDEVNPQLLKYLNRLSDFLFVVARKIARDHGEAEVPWQSRR